MPFEFLQEKSILVTGGTGSFGQKCIKFLMEKSEARRIIIFSRDEFKQHQMKNNIPDSEERLRFFIGDVRDLERLQRAFNGVDYVLHTAALKQVPALEYNPMEAIKTNILGTQNVINAALDCGVKKVILVSTDKAANPANLYGATKLCAERLMISSNSYSGDEGSRFSVVRYGNVWGSRGSFVEVVKEQRSSGEITLTHREMTRFWTTLEQCVSFVLTVLEKMWGGEIFVPKMPSIKINDLVQILAPECRLKIVGIRPGEKLHEVLVTLEEARHAREYDDYYVILPEHKSWPYSGHYLDGRELTEDFCFVSHKNKWLLDKEQTKKLLELS